jgi:hypothetical protein
MLTMRPWLASLTATTLLTLAVACTRTDQSRPASSVSVSQQAGGQVRSTAGVLVATAPSNDCDWIPVADVEAIVGKLAEPPREDEGGCLYTLPVPQHVLDERAKMAKLREAIDKMPGAEKAKPRKADQPDPYGFVLEVDLKYFGIGEKAANSTNAVLAAWAKNESDTVHDAKPHAISRDSLRKALNGWDWPATHGGRLGHIRITLRTLASDLDLQRDKLDTIAVRVRDRIPDRPFAMVGYSRSEERDPCTLITRQEAESVLGPLLIAPYRTGGDGPLAYATGPNCGYYTAGHHVVIVTPHWTRGKTEVAANNAIGGLISAVSGSTEGQSADTLEGPWDQAAMSLDGRLMLLKGDRALEIAYRGSSTDESGALKLARIAIPRLVAAKE